MLWKFATVLWNSADPSVRLLVESLVIVAVNCTSLDVGTQVGVIDGTYFRTKGVEASAMPPSSDPRMKTAATTAMPDLRDLRIGA